MATWEELRRYIASNYQVDTDKQTFLALDFTIANGRSQRVLVSHIVSTSGQEWVHIESPIGELRNTNLTTLFDRVEHQVCGSLSKVGELVTLRHSNLLADLSVEEFEVPLHLICTSADALEGAVSLQDKY